MAWISVLASSDNFAALRRSAKSPGSVRGFFVEESKSRTSAKDGRGAALALLMFGAYSLKTLGGGNHVYFHWQISSRIRIGRALPFWAAGSRSGHGCAILAPGLALGLRWQSGRRPKLELFR